MSSYSHDQAQPADSLDDRGVDDVLDEGISPPERPFHREDETLDDRLRQEEPELPVTETLPPGEDDPPDREVGDERSGRLVAPDEGSHEDDEATMVARDVGIDGGAASAEEAALHVVDETEDDETEERAEDTPADLRDLVPPEPPDE